jgi:hypothetical protein
MSGERTRRRPVRRQVSPPEPGPIDDETHHLFLAANPQVAALSSFDPQAGPVALDQEASAILKELKRSGYRDRFEP